MSVTNTPRKAGPYTGNNTDVQYTFGFKVFADSDLVVTRAVIATGAESTLVLTTDYSVTRNADQDNDPGGYITLTAALADTYTLTLTSEVAYTQPAVFTNLGGFFPAVLNNALDRLTILVQQLKETVGRSLKVAVSTPPGFDAGLPAPVPYAGIVFNADGTGFATGDTAASGASALAADLASTSAGKGSSLVGFKKTATGSVSRTVFDMLDDLWLLLTDFDGADPTGTTDSTAAFVAARNAATLTGRKILVPAGRYLCGQFEQRSNTHWIGEPGTTIVRNGNYGWCFGVFDPAVDNVTVEDIDFDNNASGAAGTHKWSVFIHQATNITFRRGRMYNGLDISIKDLGPDGMYISSGDPTMVNNILVEDFEFNGFTRNGCSIVDGLNTATFRRCLFTGCGLSGMDIEADTSTSIQVRNVLIDECRFVDNGSGALRGTDVKPAGLALLNQSSATSFHSDGVTVRRCYFNTTTATNTLGIYYFRANSAKNLRLIDNVFDTPGTASAHSVTLEESTYGSSIGEFRGNTLRDVPLLAFKFDDLKIEGNTLSGAASYIYGAATGANKHVLGNRLLSCGDASHAPISLGSINAVIRGNTIKEARVSGVPAVAIGINPQFSTALNVLNWEVDDNSVESSGAALGAFLQVVGGSSSFGIQGLKARRNKVRNCAIGLEFASSGTNPDSFDLAVDENDIEGTTGVALNFNGIARFSAIGNIIKDCATNATAINIAASERYFVTGNRISDTRSGAARAQYAILATSTSAGTPTSAVVGNLANNTQIGFSVAAGEGTSANNVAY